MRRLSFVRLAASLLLGAGAVACSDQPLSPASQLQPNAKVTITSVTDFATYQVVNFTVDQEGGWFNIGPHSVFFPASSICDPATSSYGPTEWDKPCTVISKPIAIRAEIQKSLTSGKPAIQFSPNLRFAPTKVTGREKHGKSIDPKWVMLYMFTEDALKANTESEAVALEQKFRILWSPVPSALGIDQSLADPTLKTHVQSRTGMVYRRVKHFSGYQFGSGRWSPDSTSNY